MKTHFHPSTLKKINFLISDVPHGIGITGEPRTGKGYTATHLASKMLKIDEKNVSTHPYSLVFDVERDKVGIDSVRDLQASLSMKVPNNEEINRVVIVEHADSLGHEAQNALLKTLEEPPEKTVIILTYGKPSMVLDTIKSRVQELSVLPLSSSQVSQAFAGSYSEQEISRAYSISDGRIGLLTSVLENHDQDPTLQAIQIAKGLLQKTKYQRLCEVDGLIKQDAVSSYDLLEGIRILLHASQKASQGRSNSEELKLNISRLEKVDQAILDVESGVNQKLTLSRLLSEI